MARLPKPGGDDGNWGDILNDYLSQTHDDDGSLKDKVVSENNLSADAQAKLNASGDWTSLADKPAVIAAGNDAAAARSAIDVPSNADVAAKVAKGELVINARDYGIVGNGSDETAAITALFTTVLSMNPVPGSISGTTYRTPTVYFPAGTYSWSTQIVADLAVSAGANRDRRRLIIKGDGEGATVFRPTYASGAALHVKSGLFTMVDIRWIGTGSNSFLKFGDLVPGTSYVNQFKIERVAFHNGGDMFISDWCFDGSFQDCQFSSIAANKAGVLINQHGDDNTNNVSFIRCHWEPSGSGAAYFRARGGALAAQKHSQFSFVACHFETRRYDSAALDVENANTFSFIGTRFTQNQDQAATSQPTSAISLIRIINGNGFSFDDCVIGRVASAQTDAWPNKLFSVGGSARAIRANGTFFAPLTTSSTEAKVTLWQSDTTTAYIPDGTSVIEFGEGCSIGSRTSPKISDDAITITSANARNRNWTTKIDDNNLQQLRSYYSNDVTTLDSSSPYRLGLGTDGLLTLRSGLTMATNVNINNNATDSFNFSSNSNGSKRALYIVIARTTSEHTWALVYSSGTALDTIAVGSDMAVGTTNPATPGKFNVYLNGAIINVQNLSGTAALVSCLPIGF